MPISIVKPGGEPSRWVSEEHQIVATDVIDQDGLYTDGESRYQYRKGTVLPPGKKKTLKRVGDFPAAAAQGAAEFAATVPSADERAAADARAAEEAATVQAQADAQAKADADAKAAAEKAAADAKAAPAVDNKKAAEPENKKAQ